MGGDLVDNSLSDNDESDNENIALLSTYSSKFEELFPYYLTIGMTYDQYWNEDPFIVKYYREAEKLRLEKRNQELWLQGMYIYDALCKVAPILHAFSKKGTKPGRYPEEPYPISSDEIEKRKERDLRNKTEAFKARLNAMAKNKQ